MYVFAHACAWIFLRSAHKHIIEEVPGALFVRRLSVSVLCRDRASTILNGPDAALLGNRLNEIDCSEV